MTSRRGWTLAVVLALLSAPAVLALVEAVAFHAVNRSNRTLVIDGRRRDYVLYVPSTYDRSRPAPLVISMHGAGLWGAQQQRTSRWNEVAERNGIIVVYPSAADDGGPNIWHVERNPGLARDVRFIATLIDTLESQYNIDSARVYANGLSNGGGMSFALSCTLSSRIAAVGLVASAQTLPWDWCTDTSAVPMIAFHGTRDPVVPYRGGASWISRRPFPSIPGWATSWARRNRCVQRVDSVVAPDVTLRRFTHCAADADVELYTIVGGGHTWPGGDALPEAWMGRTARSIDASETMWEFFRSHPLATRVRPHAQAH